MDYSTPPYQSMPGSGAPGMPGMPGPVPGMPGQPAATDGKKSKGSDKDGKAPTKKLVNRQFTIAAVFAVVAAVAILLVTQGTKPAGQYVAVAAGPIATNTVVDATLLKSVQISEDLIQPGAVTAASADEAVAKAEEALKNVRSQFPITANQQIVPEQFGLVVNLGRPLAPNERLVSFRASVASSVAGSIKPGDSVDIYATAGDVAGPIVFNVPVVSVTVSEDRYNAVADAQTGDKDVRAADVLPGDPVPGTYVVRVQADQVGKVIAADGTGKIYLVYRTAEAVDTPVAPTTAQDAICEGATSDIEACR